MKKKMIAAMLTVILFVIPLSACNVGVSGTLKGAHVFMFKMTGNAFGELMFEGFKKAVEEQGGRAVCKSPAEATVSAQVEMLDTLITQQVASITISTNGSTGYDEVFKRAQKAGISIISVDSAASPDYRATHIDQTDPVEIGKSLVQAAVLISCKVDYPEDGDMDKAVNEALKNYNGKVLKIGVLSAAVDMPVQNHWIKCMEEELQKDMYNGKVDPELDIKYGNDEPIESRRQAEAFIAENTVDIIVSPTTIGMFAAGEALKSSDSDIKLTGLGLPSEMKDYMPKTSSDNAFDYICPYMLLWNVKELGEIAGTATLKAANKEYDGKIDSTFSYNGKEFITIPASDGGTCIIALEPYVFHKGNIADWADVL